MTPEGRWSRLLPTRPLFPHNESANSTPSLSRESREKKVPFLPHFGTPGGRREAGMALPSRHALVCHRRRTDTAHARLESVVGMHLPARNSLTIGAMRN